MDDPATVHQTNVLTVESGRGGIIGPVAGRGGGVTRESVDVGRAPTGHHSIAQAEGLGNDGDMNPSGLKGRDSCNGDWQDYATLLGIGWRNRVGRGVVAVRERVQYSAHRVGLRKGVGRPKDVPIPYRPVKDHASKRRAKSRGERRQSSAGSATSGLRGCCANSEMRRS